MYLKIFKSILLLESARSIQFSKSKFYKGALQYIYHLTRFHFYNQYIFYFNNFNFTTIM